MGSEKSTNLFEMENDGLPDYLYDNFFFFLIRKHLWRGASNEKYFQKALRLF